MSQPAPYVPAVGFQAEETAAVAGRSTIRTAMLDAELQAVSLTLSQVLANLAVIQRDDTALRDLVVTTDSLSANVKALFSAGGVNPRGTWLTATSYSVKDVVETLTPLISYICVVAHTSGVFATDRAAGKWMVLGSEPGTGVFTSITLSTGGISLSTVGTQDLASTGNRFRDGWFARTVTAAASVVTPLVTSNGADLNITANGATSNLRLNAGASADVIPTLDNTHNLGGSGNRWKGVFTRIIDTGTTGSLSLNTNNGTTQLVVDHIASAVVALHVIGAVTGGRAYVGSQGETNSPLGLYANGTGDVGIYTNGVAGSLQFQVLHTASATRNITVTGSNGGNPTINVTGGNLAITPNVVLAGRLSVGTNPALSGSVALPYTGSVQDRNSDNTGNVRLIDTITINGRADYVRVGDTSPSSNAGVQLAAAHFGVPSTSDLPAGWWGLFEDTGGGTWKIYYNTGFGMKSIALA